MDPETNALGRREALTLIAGGLAAVACSPGAAETGATVTPRAHESNPPDVTASPRLPVAFVPHGGGPWPFADLGLPKAEHDALADYLDQLRLVPPTPPKALLVISAHWEAPVPTVMTASNPSMLFDYSGFPESTYRLSWPAPGAPALAARVRELLTAAGIASAEDATRGFDHGTFVPLMLTYPRAEIPTIQLSLKAGLDPHEHLAIGQALAPLRAEGVFIIGSGMTFHNLRAFRSASAPIAEAFDAWLREATTADAATRDQRLAAWTSAPAARQAHPREEHLIPLLVVAGAAGSDLGVLDYNGTYYGLRLSGYRFG